MCSRRLLLCRCDGWEYSTSRDAACGHITAPATHQRSRQVAPLRRRDGRRLPHGLQGRSQRRAESQRLWPGGALLPQPVPAYSEHASSLPSLSCLGTCCLRVNLPCCCLMGAGTWNMFHAPHESGEEAGQAACLSQHRHGWAHTLPSWPSFGQHFCGLQ